MTRSNALRAALAAVPVALFAFTSAAQAQTNLVFFNFNDATTQTTLLAPTSGVYQAQSSITLDPTIDQTAVTNFGGTTLNYVSGQTASAGQALAIQGGAGATAAGTGGNNGKYVQFNTVTTGYNAINFSFATQKTATGFNSNTFFYSTNGTTFTQFGAAYNPATAFALQSFDLSSIVALNNASTVTFRIFLNGATSTAGNNRIDNVQINGTQITGGGGATAPEPGSLALLIPAGLGVVGMVRRRRNK